MCHNRFLKFSGYYKYQWLLYVPVVTICTSGYYMYQWLLYVPYTLTLTTEQCTDTRNIEALSCKLCYCENEKYYMF